MWQNFQLIPGYNWKDFDKSLWNHEKQWKGINIITKNKEGKPLRGENKKFLPLLLVFQLKSQSTNYIDLDLKL